MKNIKVNKMLFLKKKSISKLDITFLETIVGGAHSLNCGKPPYTICTATCPTWTCPNN